eukprot:TRINITY_DN23522_c0_g1_i9.p1 TRINITY_DN23522_c0_g1~~TRINITY_DN23522_c0_g1_i9.p1  ORF type:complete len:106 (+),score=13.32 TRINITY_DN23522_c0_g1_i9:245-562(+)
MDHTKPYPSSYHQSQLATMNAHFSTQTDVYQGIPTMQPFKFESRGLRLPTSQLRQLHSFPHQSPPRPKLPLAKTEPKTHVAAIVQNNNNNKLKGETDGRGWDPHT